jgi:O-antigen ligase
VSLHTIAFLFGFVVLFCLMFKRSSWGIGLYLLTFYASPASYSWGETLSTTGVRWTLLAALALGVAVHLDARPYRWVTRQPWTVMWMVAYAINATFVHFFFASNPEISQEILVDLWKQVGLLYLVVTAVKDPLDVKIVLYSLVLGAGYVGYEVVFNDVGRGDDGRLWVSFGGLHGNQAAAFMCISLTIGGYLLIFGNTWERILTAVALAFSLEVVLRAMSRATLLALLIGVVWLIFRAQGRVRQLAIAGVAFGCLGLVGVMGPEQREQAFTRFMTTFKPAAQRDVSAQSRFDFWAAGIKMINEHPLGSGGEAAFESDLGTSYITHLRLGEFRSVHNGYLDTAASWGVQGLILFLVALATAWYRLNETRRKAVAAGSAKAAFLACSLETVVIVQLVTSMFNASLKGEAYVLWMGLCLACANMLSMVIEEDLQGETVEDEIELPVGERLSADFGH